MYEEDGKLFVEWTDVTEYINKVASLIRRSSSKVTGVYGIPRGGLIFAVILSHKLNIPLLTAPCKDCLVIDDIADTGKTLIHYKECGYTITTMFYHRQSCVIPDYWYEQKNDSWVVYPWEVE